jgi:hypothetical protein
LKYRYIGSKGAQGGIRSPRRGVQSATVGAQGVEAAAGYSVFSKFGMKILVAGGGSGKCIAVNQQDNGHDMREDGRDSG